MTRPCAWSSLIWIRPANDRSCCTVQVTAKMHKSLTADKTIGVGSIDLSLSAGQNGVTVVPLRSTTGGAAGEVRRMYSQAASVASHWQAVHLATAVCSQGF